jgi:hypothetical protein
LARYDSALGFSVRRKALACGRVSAAKILRLCKAFDTEKMPSFLLEEPSKAKMELDTKSAAAKQPPSSPIQFE